MSTFPNGTELVVIAIAIFALGICLGWLARADWEIRPERVRRNRTKPQGIPLARVLVEQDGRWRRRGP